MDDLPLTIVTGYLGSGKTRYINKLLMAPDKVRYAVLVNDFGELNIDAQLIKNRSTRSISLVNGCVCCSISNDLDAALAELNEMAANIDWVLLEASGVADGQRVASTVNNWPGYTLEPMITLVDVTRIQSLVTDKYVGAHIEQQLAQAKSITLTKTDLITQQQLEKIKLWLSAKTSTNRMCTSHSQPPLFYSEALQHSQPIDRQQLQNWLHQLAGTVHRVKGFVYLQDDVDHQYLLQRVGRRWQLEQKGLWPSKPQTQLVIIGTEPVNACFAGLI